ncbi:MAG: nucleoside recognition domain-containing protein [Eubacteriales bacterium]|nr:nucleoside recognition domain-containing protein [Eubacteriales bacterium]
MSLTTLVVPVILCFTACFAMRRRVDVYSALTKGAEEGLTVLLHILPSLIGLLTAVSMFRASGAMEFLGALLAPALDVLGIPAETAPLLFIRPISGSGALAVGSEIMETYGADSYIGRVAAVMLGSSETTFYTIAIYYGSAGIVKTRYTIPAALCADLVMFWASAFAVRLFMGT